MTHRRAIVITEISFGALLSRLVLLLRELLSSITGILFEIFLLHNMSCAVAKRAIVKHNRNFVWSFPLA